MPGASRYPSDLLPGPPPVDDDDDCPSTIAPGAADSLAEPASPAAAARGAGSVGWRAGDDAVRTAYAGEEDLQWQGEGDEDVYDGYDDGEHQEQQHSGGEHAGGVPQDAADLSSYGLVPMGRPSMESEWDGFTDEDARRMGRQDEGDEAWDEGAEEGGEGAEGAGGAGAEGGMVDRELSNASAWRKMLMAFLSAADYSVLPYIKDLAAEAVAADQQAWWRALASPDPALPDGATVLHVAARHMSVALCELLPGNSLSMGDPASPEAGAEHGPGGYSPEPYSGGDQDGEGGVGVGEEQGSFQGWCGDAEYYGAAAVNGYEDAAGAGVEPEEEGLDLEHRHITLAVTGTSSYISGPLPESASFASTSGPWRLPAGAQGPDAGTPRSRSGPAAQAVSTQPSPFQSQPNPNTQPWDPLKPAGSSYVSLCVNIRDARGRTPLHEASCANSAIGAAALLNAGAVLEVEDNDGRTPLHLAAERGAEDVTKELLLWQASPIALDREGMTPLHLACLHSSRRVVGRLARAAAKALGMGRASMRAFHSAPAPSFSPGPSPSPSPRGGGGPAGVPHAKPHPTPATSPGSVRMSGTPGRSRTCSGNLAPSAPTNAAAAAVALGSTATPATPAAPPNGPLPGVAPAPSSAPAPPPPTAVDDPVPPGLTRALHCRRGWTPAHMAAGAGKVGALRELAAAGHSVRTGASREPFLGWTPLHTAVVTGAASAVEVLLDKLGADPDAAAADGLTPRQMVGDLATWRRLWRRNGGGAGIGAVEAGAAARAGTGAGARAAALRAAAKQGIEVPLALPGDGRVRELFRPPPWSFRVDPAQLEVGEPLGDGAFGEVYEGRYQGEPVAIKSLKQLSAPAGTFRDGADHSDDLRDALLQEIAIMKSLRPHERVATFIGTTTGRDGAICLVMDRYPTTLQDCLCNTRRPLDARARFRIALQIAQGLRFLHGNKVVHRDLKPDNVLLTHNREAKLADFGLSRVLRAGEGGGGGMGSTGAGHPYWTAPEVIQRKPYNEKADVYSWGVIMYQLATWEHRLDEALGQRTRLFWQRAAGSYGQAPRLTSHLPSGLSAPVRSLLLACLDDDPLRRPTMDAVVGALTELPQTQRQLHQPANEPHPVEAAGGEGEEAALECKAAAVDCKEEEAEEQREAGAPQPRSAWWSAPLRLLGGLAGAVPATAGALVGPPMRALRVLTRSNAGEARSGAAARRGAGAAGAGGVPARRLAAGERTPRAASPVRRPPLAAPFMPMSPFMQASMQPSGSAAGIPSSVARPPQAQAQAQAQQAPGLGAGKTGEPGGVAHERAASPQRGPGKGPAPPPQASRLVVVAGPAAGAEAGGAVGSPAPFVPRRAPALSPFAAMGAPPGLGSPLAPVPFQLPHWGEAEEQGAARPGP
ncbi:hypothetical protein HYH03_010173 [Edaphochlamys debaryana]|uniref:Protein kinase domain-containing protein n=1 Tax=Edaphochlamys debaryana TaxID=47281 RepID=A0A836BW57_9CHLO|nr:hypothetical protein HYH03_010173 [Edaphochlamys debaryana]|eukprot:KAG2491381.1 hypothetical protein HYH03_010173 [Edaphochlamys debaryana]